jgi:hypothetical protein
MMAAPAPMMAAPAPAAAPAAPAPAAPAAKPAAAPIAASLPGGVEVFSPMSGEQLPLEVHMHLLGARRKRQR